MTGVNFELWPVLEHYGWDLPGPRPGWITVKCGVHDDSHASCRVNNDEGAMACMACGFKGDTIKYIRHMEGCSYVEAVRIAKELSGEGSERVSPSDRRGRRGVSNGPRDRKRSRGYVPPGKRSRTLGG